MFLCHVAWTAFKASFGSPYRNNSVLFIPAFIFLAGKLAGEELRAAPRRATPRRVVPLHISITTRTLVAARTWHIA